MKFSILLTSLLFMVFVSCEENLDGAQIQGSGNIVAEHRAVDAFDRIQISSVINATIVQGAQTLLVTADDNILELITTEVRDNVLYIDLEDGDYDDISIEVDIANNQLLELTSLGVNSIEVSDFQQDEMNLNIEGVGNIKMSGSANNLIINSSGASNLDAFDFTTTNCQIQLSGIGNVQITVNETLSGALSGVGNILYKGSPTIDVEVTGVGNVLDSN